MKIKPCPFCGEEPEIEQDESFLPTTKEAVNMELVIISCQNPRCYVFSMTHDPTWPEMAIKQWNRRKRMSELFEIGKSVDKNEIFFASSEVQELKSVLTGRVTKAIMIPRKELYGVVVQLASYFDDDEFADIVNDAELEKDQRIQDKPEP